MKKILGLFAIFVLTMCLGGFAFNRIALASVPTSTVLNAGETHQAMSSASPSEKEAVQLSLPVQVVVFIVTGLVCVLFGIIAVFPLFIDRTDGVIYDRRLYRSDKP